MPGSLRSSPVGGARLTALVQQIMQVLRWLLQALGFLARSHRQPAEVPGWRVLFSSCVWHQGRGEPVPAALAMDVARQVKETLGYTCSDMVREFAKHEREPGKYTKLWRSAGAGLPGPAFECRVAKERFLAAEVGPSAFQAWSIGGKLTVQLWMRWMRNFPWHVYLCSCLCPMDLADRWLCPTDLADLLAWATKCFAGSVYARCAHQGDRGAAGGKGASRAGSAADSPQCSCQQRAPWDTSSIAGAGRPGHSECPDRHKAGPLQGKLPFSERGRALSSQAEFLELAIGRRAAQ